MSSSFFQKTTTKTNAAAADPPSKNQKRMSIGENDYQMVLLNDLVNVHCR
jgi:hypothetical protein